MAVRGSWSLIALTDFEKTTCALILARSTLTQDKYKDISAINAYSTAVTNTYFVVVQIRRVFMWIEQNLDVIVHNEAALCTKLKHALSQLGAAIKKEGQQLEVVKLIVNSFPEKYVPMETAHEHASHMIDLQVAMRKLTSQICSSLSSTEDCEKSREPFQVCKTDSRAAMVDKCSAAAKRLDNEVCRLLKQVLVLVNDITSTFGLPCS